MSDSGLVGRAGAAVAESVRWLRPEASAVLLVQRGDDDLWSAVAASLAGQGRRVHRLRLPAGERAWSLPRPDATGRFRTEEGLVPADVVVHHDPFGPETPAGHSDDEGGGAGSGTLDGLRTLAAAGVGTVFVDYPHGLRPTAAGARLRRCYLRALSHPAGRLRAAAGRLAETLAGQDHLEVISGPGARCRLDVAGPFEVRTDWTSARRDAPVLQMPFAEVWVACDPGQVQGRLALAGPGGATMTATVEDGRLRWDTGGAVADPLVEIGVGMNPQARPVGPTSLFEKARGALHAGFGDSSLIGGGHVAARHYDLPLAAGSVRVARSAVPGRKV